MICALYHNTQKNAREKQKKVKKNYIIPIDNAVTLYVKCQTTGLDTTGNKIIFGECKYYTNKKMDVDVYFNLKEKAKHVIWKNENRKEKYILFSINGFTKELIELAQKEDSIILKQ